MEQWKFPDSAARARWLRLQSTPSTGLSDDDRTWLRTLLDETDQFTFDILIRFGTLGNPDAITRVAQGWPAPDRVSLEGHAEQLAAVLEPGEFAELVTQLAERWRSATKVENDDAVARALSAFVRRVKGCNRFNRIVAVDHSRPDLALELLQGSFYDPKECLRILRSRAQRDASQAFRIWHAAVIADDRELELILRDEVLEWAFARLNKPDRDAEGPMLHQAWDWIQKNAERPDCVDDIMRHAERAHANGCHWESIALSLPESLKLQAAERALQTGELTYRTGDLLKERLATGSSEAWSQFFICEAADRRLQMLPTRDLIREARLPEAPDDQFWVCFDAVWRAACALEKEQLDFAWRSVPPMLAAQPKHVQEQHIRHRWPQLFPPMSADDLIEKVLSRPPSHESARILLRELQSSPSWLGDERVAAFAPYAQPMAHDALPGVAAVDLHEATEVATFLRLHGECGPRHLRGRLREGRRPFDPHPGWLLDQPWFEAIADDGFRTEVGSWLDELSPRELADIAERHPSWVPRERVVEKVLSSPQIPREEGLPSWLDDALFARATSATSSEELNQLLPRFRNHKHYRKPFLELVHAQLLEHLDGCAVGMMADILESASSWERHGPELARSMLVARRGEVLLAVLWECDRRWRTSDTSSTRKRVEKLHLALAQGILLFTADLLDAGDHAFVERALMCIAVLDPPRTFTRDLHEFAKRRGLNQSEAEWVERLHGMAKAGAKREATMAAASDALAELLGGGEP